MKQVSHALIFADFESPWYRKWAVELKQDADHLEGHQLRANKFWQNAVIAQALWERGALSDGKLGLGFGVGQERLPALFAQLGVKVMATDQDFRAEKAGVWAKHELATGPESLNKLGISSEKKFAQNVQYQAVDMTQMPHKLYNQFDFLWSNCALGHLGSIAAGMRFIERSLECLKPGGLAVHTTELNALSNEGSVDKGGTVIFRLRDIYHLMLRLTEQGYDASPLKFFLGRTPDDFRISLQPKFGNDFSKIQVGGYLATQAVLIISKRERMTGRMFKARRRRSLTRAYKQGLKEIDNYSRANPHLRRIAESQGVPPEKIKLRPVRSRIKVRLKSGHTKELYIDYLNHSDADLYSMLGRLKGTTATLLATDKPPNRPSLFADESWVAYNQDRPSSDFFQKTDGSYRSVDFVPAGEEFAFKFKLNASQLKPGLYEENFSVVQEGKAWIKGSGVKVLITVEV